jgi:Rap1a immunity proteins
MRKILLGGLTVLMIAAANAAENTGSTNYMLPGCKITVRTKNYVAWVRCLQTIHTIRVILDLLEQDQAVGRVSLDTPWCASIPRGAPDQQVADVVAKWAEARPERMHREFTVLALFAIQDAWPCRK